jgi:hypothetical protein
VNEYEIDESTLERVRADRFGWQPGQPVVYFDDEGERITEEEFKQLLREEARLCRR